MHHIYPSAKGDPLCPLGFHPQVRWPTRCKRCFRDYKEHGGKRRDEENALRRDDTTASTPSLSWNSRDGDSQKRRNWVSSNNLAFDRGISNDSSSSDSDYNNPSSWISTPDLANLQDDTQPVTTVNLKLPKRKPKPIDTGQRTVSDSFSVVRSERSTVFNKGDSLADRAKKLQAIKESASSDRGKRIQIKEVKTISEEPTNHDVQFLIQVKSKVPKKEETVEVTDYDDDAVSLAGTETTDTTLVDVHDRELRDQLESLKKELEQTKLKCDKLEREKGDRLLRRLAALETTTSKTTASEVLKLQKKCNELQQQFEDSQDEKKSLSLKVKELEEDLELRPTAHEAQKLADELRSKLLAAETLCEELMDENEDIKKELRDMEEQMDELQDNFREDQAVEYTSIKKELDQTTKNCRILSFKLRKAERKAEQLEYDKAEAEKKLKEVSGGATAFTNIDKIKQLEQDLKVSNEVSIRLQKELDDATQKLSKFEETSKGPASKKKAPLLGNIGKVPSGEGKVSRESLTRGGSQDDPAQLLRDLQDSLEREADLREQLKFAEEEAQNLRKKVSRIEDDNESLVLQLKKMAGRARSRKLSPTNNSRLTPEPPIEKSDVSDDEDPAELKLQLELSEQEASVLRKKVEELEADNHRLKNKTKELLDKCNAKSTTKRSILSGDKGNSLQNQKLKVLEDETNDLRKKLIEKERDCERLHAELSLNQKRSRGMQKSKSLDLDQQTLDLKRQLQVIEQEATVLRNKVQSLESENEKLISENKRLNLIRGTKTFKSDKNLDKYIDQIATLEIELSDANKKIKDLEEALQNQQGIDKLVELKGETQYKKLIQRVPKKVTSLTSRDQLKTMVTDLENEIGEMLVAIKTSENSKIKLEEEMNNLKQNAEIDKILKDLDDLNNKFSSTQKELQDERTKYRDLNRTFSKVKENLEKANDDTKKYKDQYEKLNIEQEKTNKEKKQLDEEILKLKTNIKSLTYKQDEITLLTQKNESMKLSLQEKDKELQSLKKELETKTHTMIELQTQCSKQSELEAQLSEYKEQCNKIDKKIQNQNREHEINMDKKINKIKSLENEQTKLAFQWEEEKKKLTSQLDELNSKIKAIEIVVENKNKIITQLEESLSKEREIVSKTNLKADESSTREINKLKDELTKSKANLSEIESKLEASKKSQQNLEDKLKKTELENKNTKLEIEKKKNEIEIDLQNERKKIDILKNNHDKENKNKELELGALKSKIKKLEMSSLGVNKKDDDIRQLQETIDRLEVTVADEKQKYDDLTAKYEILEEEHVVTKAKLVMENETLDNQLINVKREMDKIETELKTLRETYNTKQDTWIKEKLEMQEKFKEVSKKSYSNGNDLEKTRLKASLEEKQSELDQVKKENEVINDQMEFMRKENDELKRKLDDYEKVNKVQRNISADSSAMDKEIRQLKLRLQAIEKSKKSDLAELKIRYESQLHIVNGELQSLQNQVIRFKREKDTYKHMLESAQKTIGDLKQSPNSGVKSRPIHYDELEESKSKVATLEQQISCMEDELSEARLECSRLKTELVSERSSWEVKLSELHSRVNELEEEKILNSGRTKIVGLRTRMELAWQKEREEQQRLLQETATLARDLRQTLFEVERERDKERLEAKRKQDQFKKTSEEDQDENKKKITELQCDLLELRDAHAKLRTTNEKLRREKERYEKEREEFKSALGGRKRAEQDDDRRIQAVIEQMDVLKQVAPELFFSKEAEAPYTPTPPRRTRSSRSRETSPALDKRESSLTPEDKQQQIQAIMQRLVSKTEDLRRIQSSNEDEFERERIKRSMGMRRATSTEHENSDSRYSKPYIRKNNTSSSLHRKSLSLDHNIQDDQKFWKNDDSLSSLQSLEMSSDIEASRRKRDTSLDSRLSNDSIQSDYGEKKKKKTLMGKLKTLTKSRSIDDQDPGTFSPTRPFSSKSNSASSDVNDEMRGSKKDLKERITGIFKKSGSTSRSNSVERQEPRASTQRPLMRNGSSSNVSQSAQLDATKPHKGKTKRS